MNEEEKNIFEFLKKVYNLEFKTCTIKSIDVKNIVNLIEKQQKEIEKLKSKKYILNAETNEIKEIPISDDYISKDKIRDLIQEIEKIKKLADEQIKDRRIIFAESESLNLGYSVAHGKDIDLLKEILGE